MEGRMPEKEDECVIEADSVNNELFGSFKIGDTIKLESGNEDPITDTLKKTASRLSAKPTIQIIYRMKKELPQLDQAM